MTQRLYPVSDISTGVWTTSSGSDLYAMIDEAVDSNDGDTTYVQQATTNSDVFKVALSAGVAPNTFAGHFIRGAWAMPVQGTDATFYVELRQFGVLLATAIFGMDPIFPYDYTSPQEYELLTTEADKIVDYGADLELWIRVDDVFIGIPDVARLTAVEFIVPDAPTPPLKVFGYI